MRRSFILSSILLAAVSCGSSSQEGKETVRMVADIAQTSSCREHKIISNFKSGDSDGVIAIIDEPSRATRLSRVFAASDRRDNVSAVFVKDGLPDFAGEQIACFRDEANAAYAKYVSSKDFVLLREITLCNFIHAMDTAYTVRTFTDVASIHRDGAKVVVLSSPYAAAFGIYDIQRLKERMNCSIPVIFPAAEIAARAIKDQRKNIAVICDESAAEQGLYSAVFNEQVSADKVPFIVSYTHKGSKKDMVKGLLDRYIASGSRERIDAIILDDLALETADEVARAIMIIRADKTAENHHYLKFLAPDLKIYSTAAESVDACYRQMRERNLFSHKIAKPEISDYSTVLSAQVTEKSARTTARGSYTIYEYVQN